MTTISLPTQPIFTAPTFWRRFVQTNRFVAWSLLFYLALFVGTIALTLVDTRIVTGAPVWIKPLKFAISTILYTGTLLWILSYVQGKRWLANLVLVATTIAFLVELSAIYLQVTRGVRSHFNISSAFDATVFSIMGAFVLVIWGMNMLAAFLLLFQRLSDSAFAWSLRLGLVVTIIGGGLGGLMTQPTAQQMALMQSGQTPTFVGAHSIGVEDGGPGLPFTGWSTEGGDLRIPHFVGLHALQIVPLMGILIGRWGKRLSPRGRTLLVWIGALGYLGFVLLVLWQALRGQPLLAPDNLTLAALGSLIFTVVIAALGVVMTAKQRVPANG